MKARFVRGAGTRQRIIEVATDLFHKQGVRATSPDEIIEASGTGKGQFYHYFKSKEGLVHEVLQAHLQAIKSGTAPVKYEIKSWQDLEQWFLAQVELQKSFAMTRGCPFGTVGNEVTENDELIRQDLSLIFEVVRNRLAAFFLREKAQGRLKQDADEERLADFCIATIQGAMLMGKIWRSSQPVETTVGEGLAHLRRYVIPAERRRSSRARPTL
jgi:TetR/AcrR family transcriptional regulator, transcriptional repressor for nem operon